MRFPRHGEIYRSDMAFQTAKNWARSAASRRSAPGPAIRVRRKARVLLIVRDEFPVGYSLAGCSPAEPASASPTAGHFAMNRSCRPTRNQRVVMCGLTGCLRLGVHRITSPSERPLCCTSRARAARNAVSHCGRLLPARCGPGLPSVAIVATVSCSPALGVGRCPLTGPPISFSRLCGAPCLPVRL